MAASFGTLASRLVRQWRVAIDQFKINLQNSLARHQASSRGIRLGLIWWLGQRVYGHQKSLAGCHQLISPPPVI